MMRTTDSSLEEMVLYSWLAPCQPFLAHNPFPANLLTISEHDLDITEMWEIKGDMCLHGLHTFLKKPV